MYRFLLTRQWVILTLLALVLMPTMVELGFWQLHRHQHRVAQNELISRNLKAEPLPVTDLTSPGHTVPRADYWRAVTATGTFDTEHEVVVRRRTSDDDRIGVHVLTPLDLKDGSTVLVNRGWVPAAPNQTAYPDVPPAPRGEVTVTGRLKADETTGSSGIKDLAGLPDRQVMLINSEQQSHLLSREVLGGYIEQTAPEPWADCPSRSPPPTTARSARTWRTPSSGGCSSPPSPVGWIILVRREKRDREEAAAKGEPADTAGQPEPASA
ncbi:SURF1-like protein OS=Streptomyces microflavus OX=1919 GN=G3I39_30400 PE=3 SV=1 [Streptomyces microflavus]